MPVEIEPHRRGLVRTVQLLVGDRAAAEEIVTQVYTAFPHEWRAEDGLAPETWLYRAAVRRVRGWVEAGNRFPGSGPGGPVAVRGGGGALVAEVAALPLPEREAVALHESPLDRAALPAALEASAEQARERVAIGQTAVLARLAARWPWLGWALRPDPDGAPPRRLSRRWALALVFLQLDWWSGGPVRTGLQAAAAIGGGVAAGLGLAAWLWSRAPGAPEPTPEEPAEPDLPVASGEAPDARPPPPGEPPPAPPPAARRTAGVARPPPVPVAAGCTPVAEVPCDGVDQDCDGADAPRDGFVDADGDGFGGAEASGCAVATRGGDCDDADPAVHEAFDAAAAVAPIGTLAEQNAAYAVVVAAREAGSWALVGPAAEDYRRRFPEGVHVDLTWLDGLEAAVRQGRHADVADLAERLADRPGLAEKRPELATRRAEALVELGRCEEALAVDEVPPKALRRLEDRCRTR